MEGGLFVRLCTDKCALPVGLFRGRAGSGAWARPVENRRLRLCFPLLCRRDTGVLPAKCTGCWDINSPRPKQHRHLVCGEGGRHGWEEGGWKARCLEEGFHQEITYSKAAVSTSPYHITHQYILVFYLSYFSLHMANFRRELMTERQPLIRLSGL